MIVMSNLKLQKSCLCGCIFTLPFTVTSVHLPLVGGNLPEFFLLVGVIFGFLEYLVTPLSLDKNELCGFKFLGLMFLWAVISSIIGVVLYPYYSVIDLIQMENFKNFYDNLASFSICLDDLFAIKWWLSYKAVKYSFTYVFFSFVISFWIYHLYKDRWQEGISDIKRTLAGICIVLICYSVIEVGYLFGFVFCKNLLALINPIYMDIQSNHGWWPPLFWTQSQLRSMFPEPSFFGIFAAMTIPFFMGDFYNKKSVNMCFFILIYTFLVVMLVLSKARTGLILFLIEFFLIICWSLIYRFHQWKRLILLLSCTGVAFLAGLGLISQFQPVSAQDALQSNQVNVESYVSDNIASAVGNKRSNNARRANVMATFRTGLDSPLLGIGINMRNEAVAEHLTEEEKENGEVSLWMRYMDEKGPLKSGFPNLNQFSVVFAEQGIIGLILFIIPLGYIFYMIAKRMDILRDCRIACLCISFAGLVIAFLANEAKLSVFIIIGLLICALLNYKEEKEDFNE